jgi:hypothetical protein
MNLEELRSRSGFIAFVMLVLWVILRILSGGEAVGFLFGIATIGSFALLAWIAAVVADATVRTLKREK